MIGVNEAAGDYDDTFIEDHEEEIVVTALKRYYDVCKNNRLETDLKILDAIELVLKDFMTPSEYLKWLDSK